MKPSGIEWIGDIPAEWETKKLRYAAKLRTESGSFSDGDIYIGLENIESSTGKYIQTETEYNEGIYDIVKEGDVLFGKLRPYLEKVYISKINGFCTSEFLNFKEFEGDKHYLYYFLFSHGFIEIVNSSTYGAKMPRAEWDFIKNLKIPLPPPKEQQAIAAFLDTQCAGIDGIITEMKQQVEILKQYKTSLITETVTKGLDKDAPMKDSGIKWIGKIPVHWEVGCVKYACDIIMGQSPESSEVNDINGKYQFMQGNADFTDLYPAPILFCDKPHKKSRIGDVLMSVRAPVGEMNISDKIYGIGRGLCSIKPLQLYSEYFWYFMLKSKEDFGYYSNGSTFDAITILNLLNFPILTPPRKEQQAIAVFLDTQCTKIKSIIAEKRQSIETMKAYKKSLIYEYVTGKKRVVEDT
jgi:type I restriction enzyme S subunit